MNILSREGAESSCSYHLGMNLGAMNNSTNYADLTPDEISSIVSALMP